MTINHDHDYNNIWYKSPNVWHFDREKQLLFFSLRSSRFPSFRRRDRSSERRRSTPGVSKKLGTSAEGWAKMGRGWGGKESFRRLVPATYYLFFACFFGIGKETAATEATLESREKGPSWHSWILILTFQSYVNCYHSLKRLAKLLHWWLRRWLAGEQKVFKFLSTSTLQTSLINGPRKKRWKRKQYDYDKNLLTILFHLRCSFVIINQYQTTRQRYIRHIKFIEFHKSSLFNTWYKMRLNTTKCEPNYH